ncbi:MAG: aminoacyl--tRNA ligase-related protein [Candidatus Anstonellales archaeon]
MHDIDTPDALKDADDFSKWYTKVVEAAGIIDKRYNVKGAFVWLPWGYDIMLRIKSLWDSQLKANGYKEMYFPLLVPLEYARINDEWWRGFENEAFYVSGGKDGKQDYVLRPTGEPAMYPMFSLWIHSYRDLPLKIYETVSSFRYETKHTRPLIRDREITVWHEIHTCHATKQEAEEEIRFHMAIWDSIWDSLCITPLKVVKPKWEVFPGAVGAIEYYSVMPNGRVLENGSLNNLGQAYSRKFNIKFRNERGEEEYAWMTCTGNGARFLAAVIASFGDERGLVLPPSIAPIQAIIIPISHAQLEEANKLKGLLIKEGIRADVDSSSETLGSKRYNWEIKGVPLRIELGKQELSKGVVSVFRRDTLQKQELSMDKVTNSVKGLLSSISDSMRAKSKEALISKLRPCSKESQLKDEINSGNIAVVHYCNTEPCWHKIAEIEEGIELFGTSLEDGEKGKCIVCGKETRVVGYVQRTY